MPLPPPTPAIAGLKAYKVPRHPAPIDLRLDGNEGPPPEAALLDALPQAGPEALRRYPNARRLERKLAERQATKKALQDKLAETKRNLAN